MTNTTRFAGDRAYISLFSGALGLDLGLEAAGLKPLAVNEYDRTICNTIRANRPGLKLYDCDMRNLDSKFLSHDLGVEHEQLFAIVGGPPCQAFSTAGRRLGLNDERGNVFLHFIGLIKALRPKYAIFENVRGLLSAPLKHRPHNQRGNGFPGLDPDELPGGALLHVLRLLEGAGYATTFTLYNTANYGVPQIRERLIFFACREGAHIPYIPPTHNKKGSGGLKPWRTLRDALRERLSNTDCNRFPEKRLRYFAMLKEGQNWRDLPEKLQREAMGPSYYAGGGKTGFYRRLAWDKPSPTLVTRPNMPATALCHPTELRPLSVAEYAAIQTFPDGYFFQGKLDDKYRQIGNAVPPLFAEAIGQHIINFDEGRLSDDLGASNLSRYRGTDHDSWKQSILEQQRYLF
jgi:DNA (cytosine-5)-methyltransferase 1